MLNKMTIKLRVIFFLLFMSFLLLTVGFVGIYGIKKRSEELLQTQTMGMSAIQPLNRILNSYNPDIDETVEGLLSKEISWVEGNKKITDSEMMIDKLWQDYLKISQTPIQKKIVNLLEPLLKSAKENFLQLHKIINQEDIDKLKVYALTDMPRVIDPINKLLKNLIETHVQESNQIYKNSLESSQDIIFLLGLLLFAGISIGTILAFIIIFSITQPLASALKIIERLDKGENFPELEIYAQDEIGKLITLVMPLIKAMRTNIDEMMSKFLLLTSSSQEIALSVTQVSSATSETAAAVAETTTTIEELKQTAHVLAEKAQEVLVSVENPLAVIKTSERSLNATIDDMNLIQEKMKVISDSIIKLSEHSLAIGEIIDTVNDLAEQSNLLAVNAAIEAAMAGDQGKSFGVVAQEIRVLAEQSKRATVQVHAILNDIQSATSAAVIATEKGSKAVSKGVDQSRQTSESILSLMQSMSKATQAAKQIALSSRQQLVGVDQVTIAMTNINSAANLHAEQLRQMETSIISMNTAGEVLKQLKNQYKTV